ncbi:MAG: SxtJ family membrane protein [Pseudomonadota bacterium]|nr:SxtJ family membrane protein [Pseudomonadota bacterium]
MNPREKSPPTEGLDLSSNKAFGLVFSIVFLLLSVWPTFSGSELRVWALLTAILLALISFIKPTVLKPFNNLWMQFGLLLHKIAGPIVMGLLFYLVLTPTALLMRIFKKRPIPLKFDRSLNSYWVRREPPGPDPDTMKNQF